MKRLIAILLLTGLALGVAAQTTSLPHARKRAVYGTDSYVAPSRYDYTLAARQILSDIRSAVDANLAAIHKAVQQNLYRQFGLEPRWLHHVDAFTIDGTGQKGYVYAYDDTTRSYGGKTWVEVDTTGRTLHKFTAK